MKVVIIGSGNVATVLGRVIKSAGHNIVAVVSRNKLHAALLADKLGAGSHSNFESIYADGEIYIIAVADAAINNVVDVLDLQGKLIVHTSGAVSKNVLQSASERYGVLYPLQSLRKEAEHIPEIPLFIDGNINETLAVIKTFGESISSQVVFAGDEERLKLHLCGVIVSNFTNHLYALTADYCGSEGADFSMLVPLIKEVASRTSGYAPASMQTGPALRGDIETLDKHLQLLKAYPQLQKIYGQLTESISEFHRQG